MRIAEQFMAGAFFLILLFLVLSRATEFNTIIAAVSNFATQQTRALQGVTTAGATVIQPTSRTGGANLFGGAAYQPV